MHDRGRAGSPSTEKLEHRRRGTRSPFRVFLSYRRDDAAGYAGRLYDALTAHFGEARVFMDVAAIGPGVDFVAVIEQAVSSCDALIVLIGRTWTRTQDASGQRRLDDPDDVVVLEVATALERKLPVIPVVVAGAKLPSATELPEALSELPGRNALELSDARWAYDVRRLIDELHRIEHATGEGAHAEAFLWG